MDGSPAVARLAPEVSNFVRCRRVVILSQTFNLEIPMADTQPATPVSLTGKPFTAMRGSEKITWIGKCVVMLLTGGFAFPNIFVE